MTIGELIRNKRQEKGWSMQDLGNVAKITTAYISDIENNKKKTPPANDTLIRIAKSLDMSTEQINELLKLAAIERTPEIIIEELNVLKKKVEKLENEKKNQGNFNNIKDSKITIKHINIRTGLSNSYDENDIIEKINNLPEDMQKEVFEFINFKFMLFNKNNT